MTQSNVQVEEKVKMILQEPGKYAVVYINDDKTPMDFVIAVLEEVFNYTSEKATEMTIRIHESKSQVVATYNYEIAEQKTTETLMLAKNFGYPFRCEMVQE